MELKQRALDSSLAGAERTRERRRRPRLATLEEGEDGPGRSVDRRGQHDDGGGVDWGQREAPWGRLDAGERAQSGAQATELDAEPDPMRLVDGPRPEDALDEAIAGDVGGPGLCEGADQSKQDRASGERYTASRAANRAPAGIDDEIGGDEQGLNFIETDQADHAGSDEARRRRRQGASGPADLGDQGRDSCGDGGSVRAVERNRGVRDLNSAERELGAGELGPGRERRRHGGGGRVNRCQSLLGGLELADEELAPRSDQAGVERVGVIAERVERLRSGVEHVNWPCQIARGERHLGLGDLAAGLGESLSGAEAARSTSQELARPLVVAELGHRNAAQGDRRRVVAQRDALKCTERITGRQRARGRGNERVHGGRDGVGAFGAGRRRGTGLAFIRIGSRSDRYRDQALHEFTAEQGEVKNAGQARKTHKTHRIWSGPIFPERIAKLSKYKLLINSNLSTTRPGLSQPVKKTSTGLSSLPRALQIWAQKRDSLLQSLQGATNQSSIQKHSAVHEMHFDVAIIGGGFRARWRRSIYLRMGVTFQRRTVLPGADKNASPRAKMPVDRPDRKADKA